MKEFSQLPAKMPVLHNVGNHELYNFSRDELERSALYPGNSCLELNESFPESGYNKKHFTSRSHHIQSSALSIWIAMTSVFLVGRKLPAVWRCYQPTAQIQQKWWPPQPCWPSRSRKALCQFNGSLSKEQLSWLHTVLTQAEANKQKAVIFSHVPFNPEVGDPVTLLWNYQDVLDVLQQFNCVVACFHGHTHVWDYAVDDKGVHYCVFDGVVEAPGFQCICHTAC